MSVTRETMKQAMAMSQKKAIKIELTMDVYEKLVQDGGKRNFAKHISKLIKTYEPAFASDNGLQATLQDILVRLAKLEAKDVHPVTTKQNIDRPELDFDATHAAMSEREVGKSVDEEQFCRQNGRRTVMQSWLAMTNRFKR